MKNDILKIVKGSDDINEEDYVVIDKYLGEGGASSNYIVSLNGKKYFLKWMNLNIIGDNIYQSISDKIDICNPLKNVLIWPRAIAVTTNDTIEQSFGYMTELIRNNCYDMSSFLRKDGDPRQQRFSSDAAMLMTGLNIVTAFKRLCMFGYSYNCLSIKDIFIDPMSGDIQLIGVDRILPIGESSQLLGYTGYIAPEIIRSSYKAKPDIYSDRFTLAIILFRLFCVDHPFEGRLWSKYPFFTKAVEDELYGNHPVYNMSTITEVNRPDDYFAPNVMERAASIDVEIMKEFEKTFVEGIDNPKMRTTETRWIEVLETAYFNETSN